MEYLHVSACMEYLQVEYLHDNRTPSRHFCAVLPTRSTPSQLNLHSALVQYSRTYLEGILGSWLVVAIPIITNAAKICLIK